MDGIGGASQVINAAIVWQWQRRTDHDPVVVDLRHSLPSAAASADSSRSDWRRIVAAGLSDSGAELRDKIRANIDPSAFCPGRCYVGGTTGSLIPSWIRSQSRPRYLNQVEWLTREMATFEMHWRRLRPLFHSTVVASLPPPSPKPDFALSRAKASWEECIHQLRSLKTLLLHAEDGPASQLQISEQHGVVRRLWQGGAQHLSALFAAPDNTARRPAVEDWDGFALRPQEWAQSLTGVTEQAIQIWVPSTHNSELDGPALPPQPTLDWGVSPVNPRARQDCAKQVTTWIAVARDLQARCQRRRGRLGARDRKEALRRMDLKTWAKSLRPTVGRLREWVLDPDGRRPTPGQQHRRYGGRSPGMGALVP